MSTEIKEKFNDRGTSMEDDVSTSEPDVLLQGYPYPTDKKYVWTNLVAIGFAHLMLVPAFMMFTWGRLALAVILYWIVGGFGITFCYHRYLTHRSFECKPWIKYLTSILGCMAWEGGPLAWVAVHRLHHKLSDKEGDPHSPLESFWWGHMTWIFRYRPEVDEYEEYKKFVPDLEKDRGLVFIEKTHGYYNFIAALVLFALGTGIYDWKTGAAWVIWGVFVRIVITFHATWLVNSASHLWGYQSYKTSDNSTNNWLVALLSWGEGWHNNHHAFPYSARHGMAWWELDITWMWIKLFEKVGLVWDVKVPKNKGKFSLRGDNPN